MASVEIPSRYKAVVYDKPGELSTKIEELDIPEPGPGEVLINLSAQLPPLSSPQVLTKAVGRTLASATPTMAS